MNDLPNRLKSKRKISGLTQKGLAELLKISPVAVSRWELGHNRPNEKVLLELSNILDCDPDWLLNGITTKDKKCEDIYFLPLSLNYYFHKLSKIK